jgi:hypothetical protein
MFNGLISRNLAILDTLNMTMLNDKGVAVLLEVSTSKKHSYSFRGLFSYKEFALL